MKASTLTRNCLALLALAAMSSACVGQASDGNGNGSGPNGPGGTSGSEWDERLNARKENYGAALRTASLRLVGDLPTVAQIEELAAAPDPRPVYEAMVRGYLADPRFRVQLLDFWRNSFKLGGSAALDTAPALATQITLQKRSYLELLTATTGTCPTVTADGTVTAANCNNAVTTHAGVLTNPGVMTHFASNMAFRRVRWVQETFGCTAFPAEVGAPQEIGNGTYTAPWVFDSISGTSNGGRVDFLDTAGVVCANCHATMNHLAPLFANFNNQGQLGAQIAVLLPTEGTPVAQRTDFLPAAEQTAWRLGVTVTDLPALGQAMAADPAIAECAVARAWNLALGRGDIVDTLAAVPSAVIAAEVQAFVADGYHFDELLFRVFTSDDFLKF